MDIKEIYKIIRCWEFRNGESFIEYFGDNFCAIKEKDIMAWMELKGYISSEKLKLFLETSDYISITDCLCGYEVDYSLFPYGECDDGELAHLKAELIIAEYIFEKNIEEKLIKFAFDGDGWAIFDDEEQKKDYVQSLQEYIDNWDEEDDANYLEVLELNIDDLNKRLLSENQ